MDDDHADSARPAGTASMEDSYCTDTGLQFMVPTPILIPAILNEILGYIPISTLKALRHVSMQWAEEGWKQLRQISVLQIREMQELQDISNHFRTRKNKVVVNLRFREFVWSVVSSEIFQKFAKEYGHLIRYIHLDFKTSGYDKDENELKSIFFSMFPSLEEFVLSFQEPDMASLVASTLLSSFESENPSVDKYPLRLQRLKTLRLHRIFREEDGQFVLKLLKSAPKLQTLSISKDQRRKDMLMAKYLPRRCFPHIEFLDDDEAGNGNMIIRAFRVLRNKGFFTTSNMLLTHYLLKEKELKLDNIFHFDFHMFITYDKQLQSLKLLQCYELKTLNLVLSPSVSIHEIQSLLFSLSNTLENLSLSLNLITENACLQREYGDLWDTSVEWKKINVLCLRNIQPASFEFVDTMPTLKTLLLYGANFPNIILKGKQRKMLDSNLADGIGEMESNGENALKVLIVHCDKSKRLTSPVLVGMRNNFPHLKKLKLENLTDSGLKLIFDHLKTLEDLYLVSNEISDSGVVGLRPEVCRKLLKTKTIPQARNFPYIGNLKKLRKLEMASPKITDVSVLFGIRDCSCLRKLFLHTPKITSKSVKSLVNNMDLAVLEIEFCQQLPDTVIQYALKTFKNVGEIKINEQGSKSRTQIDQYFATRGATFHLRD